MEILYIDKFFWNMTGLGSITGLENLNVSQATDFSETFMGCKLLDEIDISSWNMSNATTFNQMFMNCISLEHIEWANNYDIMGLTGNALTQTFSGLTSYNTDLDISSIHLEYTPDKLTTLTRMFYQFGKNNGGITTHIYVNAAWPDYNAFSGLTAAGKKNIFAQASNVLNYKGDDAYKTAAGQVDYDQFTLDYIYGNGVFEIKY